MVNHSINGFQRVVVLFRKVADVFHAGVFAYAVTDVAGMAQRAGKVAFKNFRIQVFRVAAAHRLNEVSKVVATTLELLDLFVVIIIDLHRAIVADGGPAFFAFDKNRHAATAISWARTRAFFDA